MLLSLAPAGAEFRVNTVTTSDQSVPAVAADADGDFVVAWSSYYQDGSLNGIFAQRYNAAGAAQGAEFRVNTFTTGAQRFPSVAMDADGDFVVAWDSAAQDGSSTGIFAQRYNAAGVGTGRRVPRQHVHDRRTIHPRSRDGRRRRLRRRLEQPRSGRLERRRLRAALQRAGRRARRRVPRQYVHDRQPEPQRGGDGRQRRFRDRLDQQYSGPDGSEGIYAQRYNALGVAQGAEFRVNTVTTGNQSAPAVAMDASGDFVVAWTGVLRHLRPALQRRGRAAGKRVPRQQRSPPAPSRTRRGGDGCRRRLPRHLDDGFIDWSGRVGPGVYAQSFNAAGVPQGGEFRVNTFTTGGQSNSAVAMDADGDAVVAWQSVGQDGSELRRVRPALRPLPAAR